MSHNRNRFHQAGVGSRTGLQISDDVDDVEGMLDAALKHASREQEQEQEDQDQDQDDDQDDEEEEEDDDQEEEAEEEGDGQDGMMGPSGRVGAGKSSFKGRTSAKNSSSMDIGQSEYLGN